MFRLTEKWKAMYPGAGIGVAVLRGLINPERHDILDERRKELEALLRSRYSAQDRSALKSDPVLKAYAAYYRGFGKTYHVQLQLESVVFKAKSIPRISSLVQAMFMAELKNLLLTAGHDMDAVKGEVVVDASEGTESYKTLSGSQQVLKPKDMFIRDQEGVLSSIIHGPDYRTRITPATRRVLFTVYAPAGIEAGRIMEHLRDLKDNVTVASPQAEVERMEVLSEAKSGA